MRRAAAAPATAIATLVAGLVAVGGPSTAESGETPPSASAFVPGRDDYVRFAREHPQVGEPNYLPFMAWRVPVAPAGSWQGLWERARAALGGPAPPERLVFCRWRSEDFPLRVWIDAPAIPPELAEDFPSRPPEAYVEAVRHALAIWQRDLDGVASFAQAPDREHADLEIHLIAEPAQEGEPGQQVLGATPMANSCQVLGGDPARGHLDVRFRVRALRVYVADEHGLLLADQVEKVALHEIGHALGMRSHSPIPADLMFRVARDRIPRDGLGAEDVNSFLALYALPNGEIYLDPAAPGEASAHPWLPPGAPQLQLAPHVDTRLGFELQVPEGWMRIVTPYGVVIVNGVPWDYEASLQLNVHRYDSVDDYLARYGAAHLAGKRLLELGDVEVAGRTARRARLYTQDDTIEEIHFLASGDGRVLVALAECPAEDAEAYEPWFRAVLASLEVRAAKPGNAEHGRDYLAH